MKLASFILVIASVVAESQDQPPIFGPNIDTLVFPTVGSAYVRGQIEPNSPVTVYYSPFRLARLACPFVTFCYKYNGLFKKKKCSRIYDRGEAINMSVIFEEYGTVKMDFTLYSENSVCGTDDGHQITIRKDVQ